MKFVKDTRDVEPYIALDIHKEYVLVGGQNVWQEWVICPRRVEMAKFRAWAKSNMRAGCAFGAFYRRQKARLGPAQAVVATAHLIARVVYRMLKYQVEYEPLGVAEYEKQYHDQQIKYLEKRAAKLGFQLAPIVS